jgi:hypothetical protein
VQKLAVIIARLRLLLADVTMKQTQSANLRRQLHDQMNRVVTYSLYGDADLERSLGLMRDVEQKLHDAELQERHLTMIRQRVEGELESLLLTKGVEEAKTRLLALQHRKEEIEQELGAGAQAAASQTADLTRAEEELASEIRQLQHEINEASERAARSIESQRRS